MEGYTGVKSNYTNCLFTFTYLMNNYSVLETVIDSREKQYNKIDRLSILLKSLYYNRGAGS